MRSRWLGLILVSAVGCSTVVGADFDDLALAPTGESGGSSGSGAASGSGSTAGGSGGRAGTNEGGGGLSASGGSLAVSGGSGPSAGTGGFIDVGGASNGGEGGSGGESDAGAGPGGEAGASAGGTGGAAGTGGAGGSAGGGSGGVSGGGTGGGPYSSPVGVVINELKGQGDGKDYIELYNTTSAALDLSLSYISDSFDPGPSSHVVKFPTGTVIVAKKYLLIRLQQDVASGTDGTWGIAASGENLYLYDARAVLLDSLEYPGEDTANGVENGQSFGRLPDGATTTGALKVSPAAANSAP